MKNELWIASYFDFTTNEVGQLKGLVFPTYESCVSAIEEDVSRLKYLYRGEEVLIRYHNFSTTLVSNVKPIRIWKAEQVKIANTNTFTANTDTITLIDKCDDSGKTHTYIIDNKKSLAKTWFMDMYNLTAHKNPTPLEIEDFMSGKCIHCNGHHWQLFFNSVSLKQNSEPSIFK